ncbi:DUF1311 domain-containing protein [Enterobacter sp. Ap-1006]|uniref:lysozyme inhibitor LprI family protein n=1 Tax=Enterobacter sp. Ap-1006 TaxID=2608345 RepID=UPI00141E7B2B|nr:lysozyme inhibitor LprI family protein [Enterobacter sp. Ap-1006]NIF49376.1 DUF1311 domain-containing protein [Enterobacter sp. Ap-1006]
MQMTLKACLVIAACLPMLALADDPQPVKDATALREACSEYAEAGMRDCLIKQSKESEQVLEKASKSAAARIAEWDEDQRYIEKASAALETSNQRFIHYRNGQCQLAASLSGGAAGNAREIRRLSCIAELNYGRAEQLTHAVSGLAVK